MYEKTIESKRRRLKVEITHNAERAEKVVSSVQIRVRKIQFLLENMAAMCSKPKIKNWNTPTVVGASVLELANFYMYRFPYYFMRVNFSCRKLYSDTDSLLYKVEADDLYYELENFLGWAHTQCDRARRNSNLISVIGHNIQNYDLHHICLSTQECERTRTVKVMQSTDEKYKTIVLGVKVGSFETAHKNLVSICKYLRFVDKSFSGSLEKLVETLSDSVFAVMESMFADIPHSEHHLLKQKGYYPYSYMNDISKFADQELPPLEMWKNILDKGKISISSQELEKAKHMWEIFECRTMQDYND